jgi:hypothetical protein
MKRWAAGVIAISEDQQATFLVGSQASVLLTTILRRVISYAIFGFQC